jgi:diadenosine tetraphosphate (Ap4A) HIT family hydrolase
MAGPPCQTCAWLARRDAGRAPLWDDILRTPHWDVVHCEGAALEGWLVLVLRRHLSAIHDLSEDEALALGPLIRKASAALRLVVGCERTYVAQFAESEQHRHIHVHVIPRAPDMPAEQRGPRVFGLLGVAPEQAVPEARMDELARAIRPHLVAG